MTGGLQLKAKKFTTENTEITEKCFEKLIKGFGNSRHRSNKHRSIKQ